MTIIAILILEKTILVLEYMMRRILKFNIMID